MQMEPLYDLPFMPAYDPILPMQEDEGKNGVLCVRYYPSVGVGTIRVQRNLLDIMKTLGCVLNNTSRLEFFRLGKKMIIMQNEACVKYEDVLTCDGETFDMEAAVLICNDGFTSLTESEALRILESAKLHRELNNRYVVKIEI